MATSRVINTSFWRDTYVINLDPTEKLLFLYFLTNPSTNMAGIYEIDLRLVALDTGFEINQVRAVLTRFVRDGKMNYEKGWLIIYNFLKHQRPNPSILRAVEKTIESLPDWLQEIVQNDNKIDNQITLELTDPMQSNDSLSTDSPQYNLIKSNLNKLNINKPKPAKAGEASDFLVNDKKLAAKETQAKTRKGEGYRKAMSIAEGLKQRRKAS